ncbi:unnamed protein product [Ambrosiozyma monospora]|uniref:Trafficking protein particle complex subunit n=1 Tax=Ambrosiozyma monospora TaxID=43982 RepID=A0A9W7DHB3_AMBMO|nr:unnamed protein product [Ambrosiozyma monospora]
MPIYSVYMISKSGSLLYEKDFKVEGSPITKQNSNDYLVIAGTLHGVHAISSKITPPESVKPNNTSKYNSNKLGLRCISTELFNIHVNQTVTGLKIILFTSPDVTSPKAYPLYQRVYEYYCDYVLKNPFYNLDMPIRARLFDDKVLEYVDKLNV